MTTVMEETLVGFEVAKLAKEKGFLNTAPTKMSRNYYTHKGELNGDVTDYIKAYVSDGVDCSKLETIDAPTQSLLQKWLREKHAIILYISPNMGDYYALIADHKSQCETPFYTYEEALEEGLKEALELIQIPA